MSRPAHFYIDDDTSMRQLSTGKCSTADDHILNALVDESSLSRIFDPLKRSSSEGGQIWKRVRVSHTVHSCDWHKTYHTQLNQWMGSKLFVKTSSNDTVNPVSVLATHD